MIAHAQVPSSSNSYHFHGNEINYVGSSEYMTVFKSFTRASFPQFPVVVVVVVVVVVFLLFRFCFFPEAISR